MKHKKLNKKNITRLLIEIQDCAASRANAIAANAVEEYGLQREHARQTGNPLNSYAAHYNASMPSKPETC